jgi:hypothetical protein
MIARFAFALLLGALTLHPGWAGAGEEAQSLEVLVVEIAKTPAQHTALANYYRAKAEHARAEASRHESMGRAYLGGKSTQRQAFQNHCRKLTEEEQALAQEYEALAKLHEEEAKKAE